MRVVVTTEQRYERTPDGVVWTPGPHGRPFWDYYLSVFDEVRVVARVRDVATAAAAWVRADGPGVTFAAVPYYIGPRQYLRQAWSVQRAARSAVAADDAVILRVGSQIARVVEPVLRRGGRPYGVEVIADPHDLFSPGSVEHPLRPFFRRWFSRALRRQCATAAAAAYVTEHALQRRYPPAATAFATHYSDVDLPGEAFVTTPPTLPRQATALTLVSVGTLAQLYKAPDAVIDAVAACTRDGLDLRLIWVGDGRYRPELRARAAALGIGDRVRFAGQLPPGAPIRAELDRSDLFVLASRTEGLPRALVEAMARGLPCIGSTVGGIPELLPPEDMAPPGDVAALAAKIREVVTAPERMARMSARNLETARRYRDEALRERRLAFYAHVRDVTEAWLRHA